MRNERRIVLPFCSQVMTQHGWTDVSKLTAKDKLACVVDDQLAFESAEVTVVSVHNGFCGVRTGLTSEWQNVEFPDVAVGAYEATRLLSGRHFGWCEYMDIWGNKNGTFKVHQPRSVRRMVRIRADNLMHCGRFCTFVNEEFMPVRALPDDHFMFTTPGYSAYQFKVPGNLLLTRLFDPSKVIRLTCLRGQPVMGAKLRERTQAQSGAWVGHGEPMTLYRLVAGKRLATRA